MRPPETRTQRRRLLAILAISALVGLLAAAINTGRIGLFPPHVGGGDMQVAAATTHVFVDTAVPSVIHRGEYPVSALIKRAELLGRVMVSQSIVDRIARRAHVPAREIGVGARSSADVPLALSEPGSEQRASEIAGEGLPYRVEVQARPDTPVLEVYTEAPSVAGAEALGRASVAGLEEYLADVADSESLAATDRVRLRTLGPTQGAVVNGGMPGAVALVTFLVAAGLTWFGLTLLTRRRLGQPLIREPRTPGRVGDDWPHTTRLLPWTFAGFLAVLWMLPFNDIELTFQLPIDLKFDRLVLPFVVLTWAVGLLVGGRLAPRMKLTWIHAGVGAFVTVAFLSVVIGARELNRTLELEGAIKQLPLLIAYVSLFIIASTGIRATEVRAFLKYTLGLAVICAIGVLWEYRFKQNLFYEYSDTLLPGIFSVAPLDTSAVDNIGRRLVRGPAALPLEAVAMLAMALPIALVSALHASRWRDRILYGLAICILLSAAFATYRKSALLAPFSVIVTVAYFRRRELLRLAPLALVLLVLIHILAPGALGKTTTQFDPGALGVTTVSDRAADYDAVRPDMWSHLLFGRGWGSYDHFTYRILDSELLHRLLEMGVVGLIAFVGMVLSVLLSARSTINERDPTWAPFALVGAAAAVSFLMVATLFDVLAFPHATYIFLYMAGLTAVVIGRDRMPPAPPLLQRFHGARERPSGPAPDRRRRDGASHRQERVRRS